MKRKSKKNSLLACTVTRDGLLTITIGVESLAFAATHGPYVDRIDETRVDGRFSVSNPMAFAKDVAREMMDELGEDGSTLVTQMIDQACERAIEQGSEFFVDAQEVV